MALKPCLDCGALSDGTRCPTHTKARANARYARRGTTAQRGLAGTHAAMARYYRTIDATCACTTCAEHQDNDDHVCGVRGTPNNPITAGHIIARIHGGTNTADNYRPECRRCNSRNGAVLRRG